jgi:hypothetical protein
MSYSNPKLLLLLFLVSFLALGIYPHFLLLLLVLFVFLQLLQLLVISRTLTNFFKTMILVNILIPFRNKRRGCTRGLIQRSVLAWLEAVILCCSVTWHAVFDHVVPHVPRTYQTPPQYCLLSFAVSCDPCGDEISLIEDQI